MEIKRSKHSRRRRKKLHVGEYQLFGFTILIKTKEADYNNPDDIEFIHALDDAVIDIIESEGLCCAGGGGKDYTMFAMSPIGKKNNVTEDKISNVLKRVKAIDSVIDAVTFPMIDAWHFSDADDKKEEALILEAVNRLGIKDYKIIK